MTYPPERINFSGNIGHVARLRDGRIVTFFTDHKRLEDMDQEYPPVPLHMRVSDDGGRTWSDPQIVLHFPAGKGVVSGAPYPLEDSEGRLHLFMLRFFSTGWNGGDWHSVLQHTASEDGGQTWSEIKDVDFGARYTGALNSALLTDNGRILVPLSYFAPERTDGQLVSRVVYSDDGGGTWAVSNDCTVGGGGTFFESGAVEPVAVQFASGMIWMVIRTVTGYFWESFSNDGAIWTPSQQTRIVSANAPAGVLRLADGRIVLFWNNLYGEPMRESGASYARQILFGAISENEGQTWSAPRPVAQRNPDEPFRAQTTYPFLCQATDGAVVLIYHRVYAKEGRDWYNPIRELMRVDPDWLAG